MPKVISTIIEDEVTFMTQADVEYVSLVRHGANRTPFRILKNEKGGSIMNKVVTAVLVPKSLSEETYTAHLEGYRTDEFKEYDTYKSYIQVDKESIVPESVEVVTLDKDTGIMGVIGSLVEEKSDETVPNEPVATESKTEDQEVGDPTVKSETVEPKEVEKDAVDYATLDDVYSELYAMESIVGGALRQSQMSSDSRKSTVLMAVGNFQSFAEMVLSNSTAEKGVNPDDHPTLKYHLPPVESDHKESAKDNSEDASDKSIAPEVVFDENTFMGKVIEKVTELFSTKASTEEMDTRIIELTTSLSDSSSKVEGSLKEISEKFESMKELSDKVSTLTESVEKLETTPLAHKADADDDAVTTEKNDKGGAFTGTIFSNFRSV